MSSPVSPESYSQPSFFRRYGCLLFLAAFVSLLIGGFLFVRYMIFSTPLPYRIVAAMIEKVNPNLHINGLTGDIQSGLNISSITWGDAPGSPSEIRGLRIRYNGYGEAGRNHRIVLNEVAVSRAHIDLADFPSADSTTTTTTTTVSGTSTTTTTTTTTSTGGATPTPAQSSPSTHYTTRVRPRAKSTGPTLPNGLESFEIERVNIEDVLITNRSSPDFRLSIPKLAWTGLKVTQTSFDPGVVTVESDRLTLHTEPGRKLQMNGTEVTFQKWLKGLAQPALSPAIKQPIAFAADLSFLPQGDVRPFHILLDDGRLEIDGTAEGGGLLRARQVDLAGYIDPKKVFGEASAELPGDVTINAVAGAGFADGNGSMKITGGSFRLGVARFEVVPLEFAKTEQDSAVLRAVLKTEAGEITWELPLANFGDEFHPRLRSPAMKPEEALSRVFIGRSFQQLSDEEKKAIQARVPIYYPEVEK